MSTPPPPDIIEDRPVASPVSWALTFADGRVEQSADGPWNRFPQLEGTQGMRAFTIREKARALTIYPDIFRSDYGYRLLPPEPCSFFASARFATPAENAPGGTIWLYTLFGYTYQEYSSLLLVYPDRVESRLLHKSEDFSL